MESVVKVLSAFRWQGSTYGQKEGSPPAPEQAPPPKQAHFVRSSGCHQVMVSHGVAWCRIGPRPAGLTLFDLTWLNCFLIFRNLSNLLVLRMFNKCHSASPSDLRPEQPGHKATTGLDRPTRVFLGFLSDKISNPVDGHSADAANQKPKRCFRIAICLVVL